MSLFDKIHLPPVNQAYKLHTFTGNGTFQITAGSGNVDYVIIAGGGGGGGTAANWAGGGGGGAGGYITNNASLSTNSYSVVRGTGGAGASAGGNKGANGLNSSFNSQTAIGGGGGAGSASSGAQSASGGGSGGGGSYSENAGGAGTSGQGFAGSNNHGANSGGGGGASEVGSTNGNMIGGDGKLFSLTNTYYAGGGGGGQWGNGSTTVGAASAGGLGGGGGGSGNANGQDATANTGSGGGGGGGTTNTPARGGGAGADGIILIYYLNDGSITATGGTITNTSELTGVANQRVVENFSGSVVDTDRWQNTGFGAGAGNTTFTIDDQVDGGALMLVSSGTSGEGMANFNNIRQFSNTGSVFICVTKSNDVASGQNSRVGLKHGTDVTFNGGQLAGTENGYNVTSISSFCADASGFNRTNTSLGRDSSWHTFKGTTNSIGLQISS